MYLQQSKNYDSVTASGMMVIPTGSGLTGPTPSLPPVDGSIALNNTGHDQLYYAGANVWKPSTGDLVTMAAVGSAPNANGASIFPPLQVLTLQPASASFPGVVTTLTQSFSGTKSFADINVSNIINANIINADVINTNTINAPGTNYTTINPTAPTAANDGLVVNNVASTINLEFADTTHNGIVSTASQFFTGLKTFNNGLAVSPAVGGLSNVFSQNYTTIAPIPITWDPANLLFPVSPVGTITCHRVGNLVSIGASYFQAFPAGFGVINSTAAVPVQFRPTTIRKCVCIVINGFFGGPFPRGVPFNVCQGVAALNPDGTMQLGTAQEPAVPQMLSDNVTFTPFQGPGTCGLLSQTLIFDLTN